MIQTVTQDHLSFTSELIELVGPPRKCVGSVRVHNPGETQVKLRRLRLRSAEKLLASCGDVFELRVSAPLCAGETRLVPVRLALPCGTPPGAYEALLDCADEAPRVVSIRVLERRKLRVTPRVVALAGCAGESVRLRVTVRNLGNVPVLIPARAVLELHVADRVWTHYFHAAVRSQGGRGHARVLDSFTRRMQHDEPPLGRARMLSGAGPLEAQDERPIELELRLPAGLRARRKYRAVVRLGGAAVRAALQVSVVAANQTQAR
jgi:hypothetical protein